MNFLMRWLVTMSFVFANTPHAVEFVDGKKFSGLWYEIARLPNAYQTACVGSSVEYVWNPSERYTVYNRCFEETIGGKLIQYQGTAKPAEGSSFARLDLTYYWFFTKEYRIIYLSPDYQTAVMANASVEQLWIMHRHPTMPSSTLETVLAHIAPYTDLGQLIFTPQDKKGRYQ